MNLSLPPKVQRLINARIKSGKYRTPEDVVAAAVCALDHQESFGDFAPGELDQLLAEGERDIASGNVLEGQEAFAELQRLTSRKRNKSR
jgi:antitoxin ParD1/3/4